MREERRMSGAAGRGVGQHSRFDIGLERFRKPGTEPGNRITLMGATVPTYSTPYR
jgi:hypothetical protein